MGEVIPFAVAVPRKIATPQGPPPRLAYETYATDQQAQTLFRALYFGRSVDKIDLEDSPSAKIVRRH